MTQHHDSYTERSRGLATKPGETTLGSQNALPQAARTLLTPASHVAARRARRAHSTLSGERKRILLGLFAQECPRETLSRAASLAAGLDAELHVVRVLPQLTQPPRLFAKTRNEDPRHILRRILEARRATRTWLHESLGKTLPKGWLRLRSGEFFSQIERRASELSADLVVMTPEHGSSGRKVTRLAHKLGAPILVARAATEKDAIVAATDLSRPDQVVLSHAAELSARLSRPMVAVHNVAPMSVPAGPDMVLQVPLPIEPQIYEAREQSLRAAAHQLGVRTEAVVTHEIDAVEGILKEANSHDADLIVVGTHPHRWFEALMHQRVAARLVHRAKRSVLVTPTNTSSKSLTTKVRAMYTP